MFSIILIKIFSSALKEKKFFLYNFAEFSKYVSIFLPLPKSLLICFFVSIDSKSFLSDIGKKGILLTIDSVKIPKLGLPIIIFNLLNKFSLTESATLTFY